MQLLDIAKLPTAQNSAIQLHPSDDVAIARVPLSPGTELSIAGRSIRVVDYVPPGHKVAVSHKLPGEMLHRYGQRIGRALREIQPGQHVHVHNLSFQELETQYEFPEHEVAIPAPPKDIPTFQGFQRADGRAGTRNYIAVVAASNCAAHTTEQIARSFENEILPPSVDGVVAFPHGEGCGMTQGPDKIQLQRTLAGVLDHPNVSSALIIGLGCEVNQIDHYLGPRADGAPPRSDRLVGLTVQGSGGTRGTVEAARKEIRKLLEQAAAETRVAIPASKITLGLNCGGSDSFSGITANPALGVCSDMLAAIGATSVLAETTEIFGAEHLLVQRARNKDVALRLLSFIEGYKKYLRQFGGSFDDNPSPGNKEGGLTNIIEKSLGRGRQGGDIPPDGCR